MAVFGNAIAGAVLLCVGTLGACAVYTPASVRLSEGVPDNAGSVAIAPMEDESGLRADFRAAVEAAFTGRGMALNESSTLIADYAIAVQPASVGQVIRVEESEREKQVQWQSTPRRGQLFDGCDPVRAQATLAIFDRAAGKIAYRGEAETLACSVEQIDLDQLASTLVKAAWPASTP